MRLRIHPIQWDLLDHSLRRDETLRTTHVDRISRALRTLHADHPIFCLTAGHSESDEISPVEPIGMIGCNPSAFYMPSLSRKSLCMPVMPNCQVIVQNGFVFGVRFDIRMGVPTFFDMFEVSHAYCDLLHGGTSVWTMFEEHVRNVVTYSRKRVRRVDSPPSEEETEEILYRHSALACAKIDRK